MASLFKPRYTKEDPTTGERVSCQSKKWYGQYKDADGVMQRVPLSTDKAAAQAMLTELVRRVERQHAGLTDPAEEQLQRAIGEHIQDYERHLATKGRSEKHISETIRIISSISAACRLRVLADLQAATDSIEAHLSRRLDERVSHRTVNADLTAIRSFCRWLLQRKRMHNDPTLGLSQLNEEEDRRRERRSLSEQESQQLIDVTTKSERDFRGLSGKDRAIIYLLAQRTGLRRNELLSLKPESFELDAATPTVTVQAGSSKRRKKDVLPLTREVAKALTSYLDGRPLGQRLWQGAWWRRSAEMLRADLAEAGIKAVDGQGRVVDFHGQRTSFISSLARAGVAPSMAQKLARHSDVNLTMQAYTKLALEELSEAVEQLPALNSPKHNMTPMVATAAEGDSRATDPELDRIVDAWPDLPAHVREAIRTLVEAHRATTGRKRAD